MPHFCKRIVSTAFPCMLFVTLLTYFKQLHLMTGLAGNSETCFPKPSMFPEASCFVIPPKSRLEEKKREEIVCFKSAGSLIWRSFKEHEMITCESKISQF